MKQRIFQVFTALMLIVTLTAANVLMLGVNVVSFALDTLNVDKATNHKNVEFMAYFKDEKGNSVTELDTLVNNEQLKLYFQISVKQEGYFNGNIQINNSNFVLKTEGLNDTINKIEDNTIYLNQINAGETKEIEVGIETIKDEQFDLSLINMQSDISVEGIYRDSTEKDISINSNKNVILHFVVESEMKKNIVLSQEIITNQILKYKGEDKRIIQLQVNSKLNDVVFPIKSSMFTVKVPEISDVNPEIVTVNTIDELATNGKQLSQDDWNYNTDTGLLEIKVSNDAIDNKVSWIKNEEDCFIITYIFDKEVTINAEKLEINSRIEFYDEANTIVEKTNNIELSQEEKNSILSAKATEAEDSIFKGKLYAGISRDISYITDLRISLDNVYTQASVIEEIQTINGENINQQINSVYKNSIFNKNSLLNILGEDGILRILNTETNEIIADITKDTQEDENGNIIVNYPENIRTIKYELTNINKVGNIQIQNIKTINQIDKDIVKNASSISIRISGENVVSTESLIELKETETAVNLEINRQELSTMTTNENVEFRIILNSKNENNELFKDPKLRLELPEKIENIEINSINLLYEDEMTIKTATLNNNVLEIGLEGQQTNYKGDAIEGATIIINANLSTSKKVGSSTEQVKLTYTNDNAINYKDNATVIKDINIVSFAGVVLTNEIQQYGISVVNNEGESTAQVAVAEEETKSITLHKQIINNNESKILDVKILGTFPTKDAIDGINNIEVSVNSEVNVSGIDASRAKLYYTNNADATEDLENADNKWSEIIEDSKQVKKYLVVIEELDVLEEVNLTYEIELPANLDYNETAEEGYEVYYKDESTNVNDSVKSRNITLYTGKGAVLETNLSALVGGKEVDKVKEGEIIKYVISVTNIGTEEVSGAKVIGQIPEGTTYVEINRVAEDDEDEIEYITEFTDKKNVEIQIEESIGINETKVIEYLVRVNKGITEGQEISNTITTIYSDIEKQSNIAKNTLAKGDLKLQLYPLVNYDSFKIGYSYLYYVDIKNNSNIDKNNVEVKVETNSEHLKCSRISYFEEDTEIIKENLNIISIQKLPANSTVKVLAYMKLDAFNEVSVKDINMVANATVDNTTYKSNEISKVARTAILEIANSSKHDGQYIKEDDEIQYKINISNKGSKVSEGVKVIYEIPSYLVVNKIYKNQEVLETTDYMIQYNVDEKTTQIIFNGGINESETIEYTINVKVDRNIGNTEAINLLCYAKVLVNGVQIDRAEDLTHILEPIKSLPEDEEPSDGKEPSDGSNPSDEKEPSSEPSDEKVTKIVSGIAWIDENEDGKKQSSEQTISNMKVRILNTDTNEFVKDTITDDSGFYTVKLSEGKYIVVFEYDTVDYNLTDYKVSDSTDKESSKVISSKLRIDGEEKEVATSGIIEVSDLNIANINIGLVEAKTFDLKLEKIVSKIIVQNSKGTSTQEFEDEVLAKTEINAKLLNQTTVVVEYKIRITNIGEVDGYAKKIADYLSSDYKFSSDMNKDWYQSGGVVYNASLANEKIAPGETKEVTLVVTKAMTESNTGLINNTAEIVESYNEKGIKDTNSTEGNKVKGENDMASADIIIGIKTGEIVSVVMLVLTTVLIIGAAMYLVIRKVIARGI